MTKIFFDFWNKPEHYKKIDTIVSRSAQIRRYNIPWLSKRGVTDIICLREDPHPLDFDEKLLVENANMKFHRIQISGMRISEREIKQFVDKIDKILQNGGKVHVHCKFGAHRTGIFAYLYERLFNLKPKRKCLDEFFRYSYSNSDNYLNALELVDKFIKKMQVR